MAILEPVQIQPGVFSRFYSVPESGLVSVVYHTPSQSIVFLEDDSAEVWQRVYQSGGKTGPALDYIEKCLRAGGTLESDLQAESQATLSSFVEQLRDSQLVAPLEAASINQLPGCESQGSVQDTESPDENMELAVAQFLADHRTLYSLVLELTYRCNERCCHCYLPEEKEPHELSLQEIDRLFDQFASMGGFLLQLTGGEPFVRKDFIEILGLVKKYGFVTTIMSNLTLLDDRILEAVAGIYPRAVGVSLYAGRSELHDSITAVKGSFEKSVRAIRRLREAGVPVITKSPLLKSTAPHWREIQALARELGSEYQFDLSITAGNDGNHSPLAHRVTDRKVLEDIFSSQYDRLYVGDEPMSAMTGLSPETGLCGAGASGLCISPGGAIRPCVGLNITLGQWPQNSLEEVWQRSPFFSEFGAISISEIAPCSTCTDFAYCSRCPGAWHAEQGDYCKPSSYTCMLAHTFARCARG